MNPNILFPIYTSKSSRYFITEEAFNVSATKLFIFLKMKASLAVPISGRNRVFNIVPVARLMDSHITKITNHDVVVIFIFEFEADIALDIHIIIVFWYFHLPKWVKPKLFFFFKHFLVLLGEFFLSRLNGWLYELRLDHKVSIQIIQILIQHLGWTSLSSSYI